MSLQGLRSRGDGSRMSKSSWREQLRAGVGTAGGVEGASIPWLRRMGDGSFVEKVGDFVQYWVEYLDGCGGCFNFAV